MRNKDMISFVNLCWKETYWCSLGEFSNTSVFVFWAERLDQKSCFSNWYFVPISVHIVTVAEDSYGVKLNFEHKLLSVDLERSNLTFGGYVSAFRFSSVFQYDILLYSIWWNLKFSRSP